MANAMQALNEHFYFNCRLAKALQQLLPINDRNMIQLWFDKLLELDKSLEEMAIRSDYMWFILLMLQSKHIRTPFNQLPPASIIPLKQFVPLHVYEDVLILNEPNMVYNVNKPSEKDSLLHLKEKVGASTSCTVLPESETCFRPSNFWE